MKLDAAAIILRRSDEAREHLARNYGLVCLDCDEMLAIEANFTAAQQEIARLREALGGARREAGEMPFQNHQGRLVKWRAALIDDLTKALEPSGETR